MKCWSYGSHILKIQQHLSCISYVCIASVVCELKPCDKPDILRSVLFICKGVSEQLVNKNCLEKEVVFVRMGK